MSTIPSPPEKMYLTVEEFLALPDDGTERRLLRGELRPGERIVTVRNRSHGEVEARISFHLVGWLDRQPEPRGKIHGGEAGFRLRRDPDTLVGVDVAYASADLAATDPGSPHYDGPPVLAVEILSPPDKHEDILKKITAYLQAGVVVWEVDPDFRRVSVHRPGRAPETFSGEGVLTTEPELPGFRVPVARLFGA